MKESKVIEEFQEEARLEARLEARREDILEALDAKFGRRAASEFAPLLKTVSDAKRLVQLHRLAVLAGSLKQFRQGLQET